MTFCEDLIIVSDSIKKIPKFHQYNNIEVENALKIFIAGAKFRINKKTNEVSDERTL